MTGVAIKERPILFSCAMVRAILDGRKTQTRRVMKPQPPRDDEDGDYEYGNTPPKCEWYEATIVGKDGEERPGPTIFGAYYDEWGIKCPFGGPGDRLWVRETWSPDHAAFFPNYQDIYRADSHVDVENGLAYSPEAKSHFLFRWRPSIHMPRRACRIILEITSVRVERVQQISEADAMAEGIIKLPATGRFVIAKGGQYFDNTWRTAREAFQVLWDSINAAKRGFGWKDSPWVWVIGYKRLEPTP